MSFYTYMMRNYKNADNRKGDLAKDMHLDKENFPWNPNLKFDGWYRIIRDYLEWQGACDACLAVFEECWSEYVAFEKGRRRRK